MAEKTMRVTEDIRLAAELYNEHQVNCPQCNNSDPKYMCEDGCRILQGFIDAVMLAPEE